MAFKNRGFTLVELLVVITIIGVLGSIGFASFRGAQARARDTARKTDLRQLGVALEIYYQSNNSYIQTTSALCTTSNSTTFYSTIAPFMQNSDPPEDPSSGDQYCYYSEGANGKSFRLFAKLENCSDPEVYNPATCSSDPYNFSVASQDLTIAAALVPTSTPPPGPTPGPTSPPTPTTTPTPTPTTAPPPPLAMVSPPAQSAGLSPRTWSQNCGSSTYRMLIVIAADWRGNSTSPITSITYPKLGSTVALTRLTPSAYIGDFISPDPGGAFAEMFYMSNPDPGPNNITANFSGSLSFGSSCWQGVSQVAPADYRFLAGNSTTPSITVPSSSSDIIIDGVSVLWSQTIEAGSGQTQLANISAGSTQVGHSSKPPTFISTTMSWTNTGSDGRWAMVGAALKPAP